MQFDLFIIGMGPGHSDYILPIAKKTVTKVRTLLGSPRALESFEPIEGQDRTPLVGTLIEMSQVIDQAWQLGNVGVVVSGDPGYFSLLDTIKRTWPERKIKVISGLSSLQVAFAHLSMPWHDATLASFHGKQPLDEVIRFAPKKKLGLLTDPRKSPLEIAESLFLGGWRANSKVWICENLTYENERIRKYELGKLPDRVEDPAVWVITE